MGNKMRSDKKLLVRPRCDVCGKRLYRSLGPFNSYLWGKFPAYCPNCGTRLSPIKKNRLIEHDEYLWCLLFIIFFVIILPMFIILFVLLF
jgi:ssDNA-binding Zn-finger/Zn-ribbon topoisomerase 1